MASKAGGSGGGGCSMKLSLSQELLDGTGMGDLSPTKAYKRDAKNRSDITTITNQRIISQFGIHCKKSTYLVSHTLDSRPWKTSEKYDDKAVEDFRKI